MACYSPLELGSTYRFLPEGGVIYKNPGEPWDLTGADVYVVFTRIDVTPATANSTGFEREATVVNDPLGSAFYICTDEDLDAPGVWRRTWRVVQGITDVTLVPGVDFEVIEANPAA